MQNDTRAIEEPGLIKFYKVAGVAAFIALSANLLDVILGFGNTEVVHYGTRTAVEWFAVYQHNWFTGLYQLGVLNIVYMSAMLFVYAGIVIAHRHKNKIYPVLTMIIFLVSTAIYIANSAAVPMLVLANKYAAAGTEVQKTVFAAAGESVLARGEDFTPGAFPGLMLGGLVAIMMSVILLRSNIFGKKIAWIGIVGFTFLSFFTIWATFIPVYYNFAFYFFGSIGGVLALAWFTLVGIKFFKLENSAQ